MAEIVDITSIGGAAFDVFVQAPHTVTQGDERLPMIQFPLGGKIKVDSVVQSCGGGATNTSVGFSRLGLRAGFCGVIGDDEWGQGILCTLQEEGIATDATIIVEGEISSFSIILVDSASGKRTVLYSPNVNAHMCDALFDKERLSKSKWIFLNHLSDVSCVILDDLLDLIVGCDGSSLAWNPGGSQIRDGISEPIVSDILRDTEILFLNAEEALRFTRTNAIDEAMRAGTSSGVKIMCITDEERGAYLSDGTTFWHSPAVPGIKVVDTTGAGDGFAVGVTWGIIRGMDLPQALSAGILNATSVIGKIGTQAGLLSEKEIRSGLSQSTLPAVVSYIL